MAAPITKAALARRRPGGVARARSTAPSRSRRAGRPGPGAARHPDGRPARRRSRPPPRPRPRTARGAADPTRDRRAARRARQRRAAADPRRRRRPRSGGGRRRSARCSSTSRRAGRPLADGGRRPALRASAAGRHDRLLRQPLGEPGDRPVRPPARARQPARRPPDRRRPEFVQGRPHDHPRRLRAGRDEQSRDGLPARSSADLRAVPRRARAAPRRRARDRAAGLARARSTRLRDRLARHGRAAATSPGINPNEFLHQLSRRASRRRRRFVADVGQHQMWAAQSLELGRRPAVPDLGRHGRDGLRACRRRSAPSCADRGAR